MRLLGPLRVRGADGEPVGERDWRTGKHADLLRWLALDAGTPVAVPSLLDGLWPEVEDSRARASLRTAVSQLRRVLGADVIERTTDGVVLARAWVDAGRFLELAEDAARHRRDGRAAQALAAAREADALYLADVPVGDGAPAAIGEHAAALAAVRARLLGDAAEAAVELGWMRDAVEFGTRLRELDPVSERASRAVMLGFAGLGEMHHALAEFERCRRVLADELGVDPSPQTRAVHLQVLDPAPAERSAPDFVGRVSELAWLRAALADLTSGTTPPGPPVIALAGPLGSGRRRLAAVACERSGLPSAVATDAAALPVALGSQARVVIWRPDPATGDPVRELLAGDAVAPGRAVLLLVPAAGQDPAWDALADRHGLRTLQLQPLLADDVEQLAAEVLAGPVSPGLVQELVAVSAGMPERVTETARRWAATGRVVVTSAGLALAPAAAAAGADDQSGRRTLARALPLLEEDVLEVLLLAAVVDQPVTPAMLAPLLPPGDGDPRPRAARALDQLVDLALLGTSSSGAAWRHPLLRDAVHAWMRPAVRRRLHARVAGGAVIPTAERIRHWLQAGEQELACVAALEAAEECTTRGDHAGARTHLLEVCSLGDLPEASATDRAGLFERLGDACVALRRPEEARTAYARAIGIALADLLPDAARLRRKEAACSDPRLLEATPLREPAWAVLPAGSAVAPGPALESAVRDAVRQADRTRDQRGRVGARLQLAAAVLLPRREFRALHECVEEVLRLAPRPADRLRAAVVRHVPAVLLGNARLAQQPLEEAARAAEDAGERETWWRLLGMRVIVAHDLGDPRLDALLTALRSRVLEAPVDPLTPELAAFGLRVLAEREELDLAAQMVPHLAFVGGTPTPLMGHVARLAEAALAQATDEHRHAADLLRSVTEEGMATGCTLLVPEAAARLVALESAADPAGARSAFEVYDEVVAASLGGPREEYWRRLARAALRAGLGDGDGAASAAAQAGALAGQHGLQVLAAHARRTRAEQLRARQRRTLAVVHDAAPRRSERG